jgi:plastocyanin
MHSRAWVAVLGVAAMAVVPSLCAAQQPAIARTPQVVKVTSTGFDPATLVVQQGDVVRWQWESGGAVTINSGTGPTDENLGDAFPEFVLDVDHKTHDVTMNTMGDFPYFAQQGYPAMRGTITVREATPVDRTTWGKIKQLFENP